MSRRFLNPLVVLTSIMIALNTFSSPRAAIDTQQATRFLDPPYYGTTTVTSVFDHDLPLLSTWNNPDPDGNPDTLHYDNTLNGAGARSSYDQHRGIDYRLRYELVRAAAPGTVAQAGWASANHRDSYGLHVRIDHAGGFRTIYGHMSILRVQTGDPIPDSGEFQRILGVSGNTGLCIGGGTGPGGRCTDNDPPTCGAHLHFQLEENGIVVNPYGWIGGAGNDPWENDPRGTASHDLWLRYPSITNGDVFPSGAPLSAPPIAENEPGSATVDDGDAGFTTPAGCWSTGYAPGWGGDYYRRTVPGASSCPAIWTFPSAQPAGRYHVFVHVPNDNVAPGSRNATVDAARYTIRHTASPPAQPWQKTTDHAIVNQWVYPNNDHISRWAYAGTYYFSNQYSADYVMLESETLNATGMLAADAVRFAPVVYRVYLPLAMKRWPPIPDTPALNAIYNPDNDGNYTVSWQPAYLASTYTLQEATNASFTGAVTRYSGSGTSWTATGKAPGTYYYRVKATNSWGDSGWSNVQQTSVWPSTTVFYSVADAMVRSGRPTSNYGGHTYMQVGYHSSYQVMRSLARFDLSGIPSGMPIAQARLWLYVYYSYDPQGASRTIAAYRVTSAWAEGSVTWNTRPGFGGLYGWVSIPHAADGWYSVDVTDLVHEWVSGQHTNYGVWVFGNESPSDPNWRGFYTRESSSGLKPYLEITYGTRASGARSGEEAFFVSPLATPEAPPMPEMFQSPLPAPGAP